jgi:hypothetical protein
VGSPTHAELVDVAVRWLRGTRKCSIVFGEFTTALPTIPDAIGWRAGLSELVEVKVSRADFHRDRQKFHALTGRCMGRLRWYLTPPGLLKREDLPDGWGLAECGARVRVVVEPTPQEADHHHEVQLLLSAVRRHQLGVPFDAERGRVETVAEGHARRATEALVPRELQETLNAVEGPGPLFVEAR